ncbi:hypothetical protein NEOC65_002204 [Neochlamydia sp. AcF65]|nr:hypothetical protein [Neochlamydia sp. AcF65]MBS4170245.1 hypothetical protein [Neochlamydia sp. AcF95]NGY95556.1 hypothetical protein [Neochlamydia sp. AcF84]
MSVGCRLLKKFACFIFVECNKSLKSCFDPKEAVAVLAYKLNYLIGVQPILYKL